MKFFLLISLGLVALTAARPDGIFDLDLDDIGHDQSIDDDVISGTYRWRSLEGTEYFVRYVADDYGYRVLESNAVPVSGSLAANGRQALFFSLEDDDD